MPGRLNAAWHRLISFARTLRTIARKLGTDTRKASTRFAYKGTSTAIAYNHAA